MRRDPVDEIIAFNRSFRGRYPAMLRRKIERMALGPFGFFRGTFHLFSRDLVERAFDPWIEDNPFSGVEIPLVGDIHTENYGTYRAQDGSIQYDINDFDEATVGPFGFDCKRAAASLFLAAYEADRTLSEATDICAHFVRAYITSITRFASGTSASRFGYSDSRLPRPEAVRLLLERARQRSRSQFIGRLTETVNGERRLRRGDHYFELRPEHRRQAERLYRDYRERAMKLPRESRHFFDPVDIAGRIAGCGSLGRLRYVVLIEGEDDQEAKDVLLEIKESLPSAFDLARGRGDDARSRRGRAEAVTEWVRRMQTKTNRFLGFAVDAGVSFQVREIGPRDGRLEWQQIARVKELDQLAQVYAELLAKAHAKADLAWRNRGRGARWVAQSLKGREDAFIKRITAFALGYSEQVEEDHRVFASRRREVERALLG
jgi:uncharacterized protein (DUF2252 family)